jgi:T5SS/PEP-CTERM-associated repeat protein
MIQGKTSALDAMDALRLHRFENPKEKVLAGCILAALLTMPSDPAKAQPVCTGNCNFIDGDSVDVGAFDGGDGSLTIQNGDTLSAPNGGFFGFLGSGFSSVPGTDVGNVLVTGQGSRLDVGGPGGLGDLRLGSGAIGNLTISDGALVTANGDTNSTIFAPARVFIGGGGLGFLSVESGGTLLVQELNSAGIDLGFDNGDYTFDSDGALSVDGTGSSVNIDGDQAFLLVGGGGDQFGRGNLLVSNGGQVNISGQNDTRLSVGSGNGDGLVTIDGAGSTITLAGIAPQVIVGEEIGGFASGQDARLSVFNSGFLDVTSETQGAASLVIASGASKGFVSVNSGGRIRVDGDIFVSSNTPATNQQQPELRVNDTGIIDARNIFVGSSGVLTGTGTLRVSESLILSDFGLINPGDFFDSFGEVGAMRVEGNFTSNTDGVLQIRALEDGAADLLSITGSATLNGGLVSALSPDGEWSVARQYTILSADGGVVGTFDGVSSNLTYLAPSLSYTDNTVQLSLTRLGGAVQEDVLEESNAQQVSVTSRVVSTVVQSQIASTIATAFGAGVSPTTAYLPGSISTGLSAGDDASSGNIWINFTPSRYESDAILPSSSTAQKIDGTSWNFLLGADQLVAERFVVGAFAGAEGADIDINKINGKQENDGFMLGGYAGLALNEMFYASVNGNYAWMDNSFEEQAFDNPTPVEGDFDSDRYSVGIDLNAVKVIDNFDLRGQLGYNYTLEEYDSYKTSLGDTAEPKDQKLGRARLGLEASYMGESYRPYLSLAYENDVITSVDLDDEDGWVAYAGIRSVAFREGLTIEAFLSAVVGRDDQDHNMLGLNLHYAW